MKKIKALFLDIGGVLMTNGWDSRMRAQAIKEFHLEQEEFETRHQEWNPLLETDKISLDEYLNETVFWKTRDFTLQQFKTYMFAFSKPLPDMIAFMQSVKEQFHLEIAFLSNEGRELAIHRLNIANLRSIGEYFFISGFVHLQKPDPLIFKLALDVSQYHHEEVIFIDDRSAMIDAAASLGIRGITHISLKETQKALSEIL